MDSGIAVEIKGSYLKHNKATFTHKNIVNLLILYELEIWSRNLNTNFTLGDSLVITVKLIWM